MQRKLVGGIVFCMALVIGFIIFLFNRALTDIVNTSCSHGAECPMWGTISFHTNLSLGIMILIMLVGLSLIFFGKEKIKSEKVMLEKSHYDISSLNEDERLLLEKLKEANGTIFQSELVEKTNFPKVKVSRILDKLEGRRLIERKRRGMTNVVILKQP